MEMRVYIDAEKEIIVQAFYGDLTIEKGKVAMGLLWKHPKYSRDFRGIVDARNSRILLSPKELYEMVTMLKEKLADIKISVKRALMVNEPMAAAIGSIYADKMKDFHSAEVFVSDSAALRYLEVDYPIFEKLDSDEAMIFDI